MSGIRVNEWLHNSGTGGIWQSSAGNVGIASSVPTAKLVVTGDANVSGVCTASTFLPSDGALSNRRLNVNGAFTVSQKNVDTAKTGINGSERWIDMIQHYSSNGGTFTAQRVEDAPTGYKYSAKYTVTTPNSSLANGDEDMLIHRIEGQDIVHLCWGSASAKTITLSFWVKSSLTGDFTVSVQGGGGRCYVTTYTISSADTWEQKIVTIPGETSGTWVIDNGAGLAIIWDFGSGSTYEASGTDSWLSVSNVYRKAGTVRYSATNAATWQITGIQFEMGSVATPFEHRSILDEELRCFRYFYMLASGAEANQNNRAPICTGAMYTASSFFGVIPLPVKMRSTPSLYKVVGTDYFRVYGANGSDGCSDLAHQDSSPMSYAINVYDGLSQTAQAGAWAETDNAATRVGFAAEM